MRMRRSAILLTLTLVAALPAAARSDAGSELALRRRPVVLPGEAVLPAWQRPAIPGAPVPGALRSRTCATPEPQPAELDEVRTTLRRYREQLADRPRPGGTIRIAFHVITAGGKGDVSDAQLARQVEELNRNFSGSGYRFEIASVDRTDDRSWFKMAPGTGKERAAKRALAVDPARHLNVYVCAPGQNLLGWAYFPWSAPESDPIHGVVVHYTSLPGGEAPYDLGRTATHEVGHYLGLFHTFQNGCAAPGDEVDDTPFEATPAFGCPVGRNTCPAPGDDPVRNYMDYSDDACLTGFTSGQIARAHEIVPVYRPSLFTEGAPVAAARPVAALHEGSEPEEGRVLAYRGAIPNPFHGETAIRFTLPQSDMVTLRVYSVTGQLVRTLVEAQLPPGDHSAMFRAGDLPSGVYFSVLRAGGVQMSRTLVLIR